MTTLLHPNLSHGGKHLMLHGNHDCQCQKNRCFYSRSDKTNDVYELSEDVGHYSHRAACGACGSLWCRSAREEPGHSWVVFWRNLPHKGWPVLFRQKIGPNDPTFLAPVLATVLCASWTVVTPFPVLSIFRKSFATKLYLCSSQSKKKQKKEKSSTFWICWVLLFPCWVLGYSYWQAGLYII